MADTGFSSEIIEVSPRIAEEILGKNPRNRSLRPDYVRQLAGAMKRGEWVINGQPIQIAEDQTLLNGQHRLSAVVESGQTVPMLVVRGLQVETQKTMDVGTRRTLSDVLALHGERDTTNLAAVLGLLHRYRLGARLDYASRTAPTVPEALELLREEPKVRDSIAEARHVFRMTRMRVSVAGLLHYLFEEKDSGAGKEFFNALCDPSGEEPGSPVLKLRSHLERVSSERKYRTLTLTLSAMTIKAFNAWREGRTVESLSYRAGRPNPEPFPKILTRDEIEGELGD
jgi:hypothetical protein